MRKVLQQIIYEMVDQYPERFAIEYGQKTLTYAELDQISNRIANYILRLNLETESKIGILVEDRSVQIATMLGVFKAGHIFVPFDPAYPVNRTQVMIQEVDLAVVFIDQQYSELFSESQICIVNQFLAEHSHTPEDELRPELTYRIDQKMYVYFTSGSTGKPKGILGTAKGLLQFILWELETFEIQVGARYSQLASPAFDASLKDIFCCLCIGGTICIPESREIILDANHLAQWVEQSRLNMFKSVPSIFKLLASANLTSDNFPDLQHIHLAGEKLSPKHLEKWFATFAERIQVVNLYGPTETTLVKTFHPITKSDLAKSSIPIGKPMRGARILILDEKMNLCEEGEVGEIYIRTPFMTLGYFNDPVLTREKFLPNPFNNDPADLIYKTGDLGRWMFDGNLEFLGRIDFQVKIHGVRIELGDIEYQIIGYRGIREAVVIDREDQHGDKYLCAYYLSSEEITANELRTHLVQQLPEFMLPAYYIRLEKMPLTPNGKIDRKALPEPEMTDMGVEEYVAPENETQVKLAEIWSEVLGRERIGIDDNFFTIGGHSLKATSLVAKIFKEFSVELPLREIFKTPTIRELVTYIQKADQGIYQSITAVAEADYYPISSAQKRLYLLNQLTEASISYNITNLYQIKGNLDIKRLEAALNELIKRHEAFRTSFELLDGQIVQRIHEVVDFNVDYLSVDSLENLQRTVQDYIKPFDLSKSPLLRVGLIMAQNQQYLIFDMHHIISDGTSMGILLEDFSKLYQGEGLEPLTIQYKDFAVWQNEFLQSDQLKTQENYWLDLFSDTELPVLELATDYPRPAVRSFAGESLYFSIDEQITEKLQRLATNQGVTMYMALLASYNILLAKYTGQEDIIVGSPIAGRPHAELTNIVGMFVNTLALRNLPKPDLTIGQFMQQVKNGAITAFENQDYQFEMLVEKLDLERDLSHNPLFDTMFVLQNMDLGSYDLLLENEALVDGEQLQFIPKSIERDLARFDLTLTAYEVNGVLQHHLQYCTSLFKKATIERFILHYQHILEQIVENPKKQLKDLVLLTVEEQAQLINEFNRPITKGQVSTTLIQLFEEQVLRTPEETALVYQDQSMSYRELNARANQVANELLLNGVQIEQIISILIEPSFAMIAGMLGIMKAGCAYLPIDPNYPVDRIDYFLTDSRSEIILINERENYTELLDKLNYSGKVIDLIECDGHTDPSSVVITPDNLAYIIYTSGSTGRPKGVMIEHAGVCNTLQWRKQLYNLSPENAILQLMPYVFDGSVIEIFTPLISGGKFIITDPKGRLNLPFLGEMIIQHKVTHILITPRFYQSVLQNISDKLQGLQVVSLAGESFAKDLVEKHYSMLPEVRLCNEYGPTENSICSTMTEIRLDDELVLVGEPITNVHCYVINSHYQLQPIGIPGELCVSGKGVARGYLNQVELTNAKFVPNPFDPAEKMYHTGDLMRWHSDGRLEFLGRIDHQVKIRGYRIELGEIEKCLLEHPEISDVVVLDQADSTGERCLVAYYVTQDISKELNLRDFLSQILPDYMIPVEFIALEKLPLNQNGKVDRKALLRIQPQEHIREYVAPADEIERRLSVIWQEVLGVKQIGVTENFFDIGGHSLKATYMVSQVFKEFHVELPIRQVFKTPTIRELAVFIKHAEGNLYTSIQPVENREYYPLSSAQRRLYVLNQFQSLKTGYNIPLILKVQGEFEREVFVQAIHQLIQRHEAFRTSFVEIDGEVRQKIEQTVNFDLYTKKVQPDQLNQAITEFIQPFDLSKAPLFRVALIESGEEEILIFDLHHIITDGVSMEILTAEFIQLYAGRRLPELRIQYRDFAVWQNELFSSGGMEKQAAYWLDVFNSGEIPQLNLPTDFHRPAVLSFAGEHLALSLTEDLTGQLQQLAKTEGTTLYMVLLATFNLLLSKYTGQEDIVVGTPIAGRPHPDLTQIIGMFVNTLAMRNHVQGELSFTEFLNQVKETALLAYENQDYPFEMLIDKLNLERDLSRNPLFDVMFTLQSDQYVREPLELDLEFSPYAFDTQISKFDLTLSLREVDGRIIGGFEYSSALFTTETIQRMIKHWKYLLSQIVENSGVCLDTISLVAPEEQKELLYLYNQTQTDYPAHQTLDRLFTEQVLYNPEQIAVIYQDQQISYSELAKRVNQVARVLQQKGVQANQLVGLMLERSLEMIIGIFGVLKAGGAYLPIDPTNPVPRIEYLLNDSNTRLLLCQTKIHQELLQELDFSGEVIDIVGDEISMAEDGEVVNQTTAENLAYVIYTSGTTGQPKGNLTTHANISRVVKETNYIEITPEDRLLQLSNYAFDGSTFDIYGALLNGAQLIMVPKEVLLEVNELAKLIIEQRVTVMFVTTALFNLLVDTNLSALSSESSSLRKILFGGERVSVAHAKKAVDHLGRDRLIHVYGPTESTVFATYYPIQEIREDAITVPIGSPIANTQIYVLTQEKQLAPIGVVGELWIAGAGLAEGYLNREELTAEKFITHTFEDGNAQRVYRSGDLAKRLSGGVLEFVGRIDNQVKIRGFRIEPGEIEKQILEYPEIKEVIVIDRLDETAGRYLVAYYVADCEVNALELRLNLAQRLPEYMIPLYLIQLPELPLNQNGKVNREALPKPDGSCQLREYVPPTTEVEARLATIWERILGLTQVGITDNFFEIGGHSLKATTMVSQVFKEFNVQLPIREVFKTPTISDLANYISKAEQNIYASIEQCAVSEYYPLSSAQRRLYVLNQLEEMKTGYNMPGIFQITGQLDEERLTQTMQKLIQRHESLRTLFTVVDGEVVQMILPEVEFALTSEEILEEVELEEAVQRFIQPFDLSKAPLCRVGLIKQGRRQYLIFDMHHIISDGVSMEILTSEFVRLYTGDELTELRIQYKDFAIWQNRLLNSEQIQIQEDYWLALFAEDVRQGTLPVLNLATDYPRPAMMKFTGETINFNIDSATTTGLINLANQHGATLYMVLLAAYNILLAKYTGQEDIIVGSPIAGRPHSDLDNIIGMFVNTLVLRNQPEGQLTISQFIEQIKEHALSAFEYQDYQFEMLVQKLELRRDMSRNALFDVMFVFQSSHSAREMGNSELTFRPVSFEKNVSKFDLTLNLREVSGQIQGNLEFATHLFKLETMQRFINHLQILLRQMTTEQAKRLRDIDLLSTAERLQVLNSFNQTNCAYPMNQTIHEFFGTKVKQNPTHIALVDGDRELSYQELDQLANQLAKHLITKGLQREQIVGILLDRSIEMILCMFGVLKAGGAYLPIDSSYPKSRIDYMLKDSQAQFLLTQKDLGVELDYTGETVLLDQLDLHGESVLLPTIEVKPSDLAYVIYTSGSTGQPKGVLIEHRGVLNLAKFMGEEFEITPADRVLQFASCSFDASVSEIYETLLNGATLCLVSEDILKDYQLFENFVTEQRISFMTLPPIYLSNLSDLPTVQRLVTAGSATNYELVKKWAKQVQYYNAYGPTEVTVCASTWRSSQEELTNLELERSIPIGRPIDNTQIYILDQYLNPVPIGVAGEICVASVGMARGYLHRPELSAEKFISSPFAPLTTLYKTGDLGRWLADGNIEFMGRIDSQVKVRGHRIEPGEVEYQLREINGVKDAVVIDKTDGHGDTYLAAYLVVLEKCTPTELRKSLGERVPEYMIPTHFIFLDEIPVTSSGKVDLRALPEPETSIARGEYVAPNTEIEKILVEIWQEVLGIDKVGIRDNFFELGGDSIKAIQIAARLQKYQMRVETKDLFQHLNIEELADYVKVLDSKVVRGVVTGRVELSPIQKQFFEENYPEKHHYNQTVMLYNKDGFDIDILQMAFTKIVQHHDMLRAVYREEDGQIIQEIRELTEELFTLEVIPLLHLTEQRELAEGLKAEANRIQRSINLATGPLIKLGLFKTNHGDHLLIVIHHLVVDGVSWRIIFEDFGVGYQQAAQGLEIQLQERTDSYQDWARGIFEYANSSEFKFEKDYWETVVSQEVQSISKDFVPDDEYQGGKLTINLSSVKTTELLQNVNQAYGTEINDILLTALALAYQAWTDTDTVAFVLEGHGREGILRDIDITRTIGWFTSTYPVVLELKNPEDIGYEIKNCKEILRQIPNKGIGYGFLKYLVEDVDVAFRLQPEILFNYLGQFDQDVASHNQVFDISPFSTGDSVSPEIKSNYCLEITGMVSRGCMNISFVYNQAVFSEQQISRFVKLYEERLLQIIEHCQDKSERELTPSDVGDTELSLEEFDFISDFVDGLDLDEEDLYE